MKRILCLAVMVLSIFTFMGCTKEQVPDVSVESIMTSIKAGMKEDMMATGAKEDMFKEGRLPGFMETDLTAADDKGFVQTEINKEDLEEGISLMQMMNVKSDMIFVLKAKDEAKVDSLKEALEKEKEKQVKIWEQYLPDQYEKVQNNIIKTKGKYLLYVTYEKPEKIEEIFDNALK